MSIKDKDTSQELQQFVKEAIAAKIPFAIQGGGSKAFYGNPVDAGPLDVTSHTGVVSYDPTELCITVRAGTPLSELESLLAEHQQVLPFEPPQYTNKATIGGAIASGISGPRRAYSGSVRDAILGVQIINGEGEVVNFGGQVMKNVAGYDLSRLMVRSLGTLGLILNVSIRVIPKPEQDLTLSFDASQEDALAFFQKLRLQLLPVTATLWKDGKVYIRFSASEKILQSTQQKMASEHKLDESPLTNDFWTAIRDHQDDFFNNSDKTLWRLSLPPTSDNIVRINDPQLIEWGGAQRWVNSNAPANIIHSIASSRGGYATAFKRREPGNAVFPALEPNLLNLHRQLKQKMDPHGLFNPNRMYQGV